MNESRQQMNHALKEIVLPELRILGFSGSFPHFRRITESEIHLITFQFDRYGGGFIIEIAKTKNEKFQTSHGKIIEPKKLTAHDLNKRIRIHPKGILKNSSIDDWFRYDSISSKSKNIYSEVANQVVDKIDLIEELFKK